MDDAKMLQVSRSEVKYLLSAEAAMSLQMELDRLLQRDAYSQMGSYCVRSLYFDSLYDTDFRDKYAGYEKRKKIRLRIYHTGAESGKLEIKEKNGNYSRKRSILLSRAEMMSAADGAYEFLLDHSSDLSVELYSLLACGGYRPKSIIEYQRLAFLFPENHTRITLDSQVRCSEMDLHLFHEDLPWVPVLTEQVILEVKFDGQLVRVISDILKKYTLTQVSVSKYALGRPISAGYIF